MKNLKSENIIPEILRRSGFKELNPVQQLSVDNDLLMGVNQVVAAATASGKTLIAEIATLNTVRKGKKVVFIVPLKALASEKFEDFKKKYKSLGLRVAMSIGDYDKGETWLANFDLIICTSEKLDSLLRHRIDWINDIGLVVVDEIHLLGNSGRGATLEMVLTRLRQKISPEVLGLSATISNYKELADWLSAKPLKSDWRPVKLYKGVSFGKMVDFKPEYSMTLKEEGIFGLIEDTIEQNKQALVFVSSRRNAEAAAEQFGQIVAEKLNLDNDENLEKIARRGQGSLEKSSKQCRRLAKCIRTGTAFHHAGLLYSQRKLVEDSFKDKKIKIIVATPTLAWGVNLPASRVIIRDLKRFNMGYGMAWIPVMDVEQMCGRAYRGATAGPSLGDNMPFIINDDVQITGTLTMAVSDGDGDDDGNGNGTTTVTVGDITSVVAGGGISVSGGSSGDATVSVDSGGINNARLADNAVTSAKIVNETIVSADINDGTIVGADISSSADLSVDAITATGDINQSTGQIGAVKAAAYINGLAAGCSITRSDNSQGASIGCTRTALGVYAIDFNFDLSNSYWQVTAQKLTGTGTIATVRYLGIPNDTVYVYLRNYTGAMEDEDFMITVY